MVNLLIILDSPTTIFQPLSIVSGRVIVENLKPLNVQSIFLKVCGKASVKFFRSSGNHTVTYKNRENYIQKKLILWSKKSEDKLAIGSHEYGFKFQLPSKCLPQFNNKIGRICYSLKAVVNIPWGLNKSKEITLNVSPTLDLTKEPQLLKPITFVTQQPLSASASIQHRAFTNGDKIHLSVDIQNNTNYNITFVETGLKCYAEFKGQREGIFMGCEKTKHMTSVLNSKKLPFELPIGKEGTFNRTFTIPQCMPTIKESEIIKIDYFVFVKFHVNGIWDFYFSYIATNTPTCPKIGIPIIISKSISRPPKKIQSSPKTITTNVLKDIPISLMPHPISDYKISVDPPSYEEAIGVINYDKENKIPL